MEEKVRTQKSMKTRDGQLFQKKVIKEEEEENENLTWPKRCREHQILRDQQNGWQQQIGPDQQNGSWQEIVPRLTKWIATPIRVATN